MLVSSAVDTLLLWTTSMNSFCVIIGKRMFFTICSPRTCLLTAPAITRFLFWHSFSAQQSTALNNSTSLTFNVTLLTNSSTTEISTVITSLDFNAFSVSLSIKSHWKNAKDLYFHSIERAWCKTQKRFEKLYIPSQVISTFTG